MTAFAVENHQQKKTNSSHNKIREFGVAVSVCQVDVSLDELVDQVEVDQLVSAGQVHVDDGAAHVVTAVALRLQGTCQKEDFQLTKMKKWFYSGSKPLNVIAVNVIIRLM